jgi:hypothetical protein
MTNEKYYGKIVESALDTGEKRTSILSEHPRLTESYGICGMRTRHFLNALLSNGKFSYLEMGIFRGASLACALYKNNEIGNVYAVDNWQYSPTDHPQIKYEADGKTIIPWANVMLAAKDTLAKFVKQKVTIIEKNWLDLRKSDIPEPIDVLHLHANPTVTKGDITSYLNTVYPFLQTVSIVIVEQHILDDVKNAVATWCKDKNINIDYKFSKSSDSLNNVDHWGGGIGVYVLTKKDITK